MCKVLNFLIFLHFIIVGYLKPKFKPFSKLKLKLKFTIESTPKEDEVEKDVPADWIVSEEDKEASEMAVPDEYKACTVDQFTIWVDPLDGTKEYTEGFLDHVTVLIGIAVGKRAVAGVINQPFFNYENKGYLDF